MRRRIVVLALVAASLAIALFGAPLAVGVAGYFLQGEQSELERTAAAIALQVVASEAGLDGPNLTAPAGFDGEIGLYAESGKRLAGTGPERLPPDERRSGDIGEQVVVVQPITQAGSTTSYLRVATPHTDVYWRIVLVWSAMSALALLALGIAALVAIRMSRRLTAPMVKLSAAARRLGDGDFSVRAPRSGVPEIDSLAETLDGAAADIAATVQRERDFASHASHQLRTPVTGLRLELEAALEDPTADRRVAMVGAVGTADRLEATIADLLELSGRRPTRGPVADVPLLLAETALAWGGRLASQARRLEVNPGTTPATVASAAAVRQILFVLVDNAAEHGAGTVTITARDAAGVPAIDVADRGEGPPPGADPFGPSERPGRGIGLPMAPRLAESEGGRLTLSRVAPTVFTLLLPVAP